MPFILHPWNLLLLILAVWMNRQQQEAITHLQTENFLLREKLGKKRILLNADQRRRLAANGKILASKRLHEMGTMCTPDTIFRWHRQLVARKWDYSRRPQSTIGRPRVRQVIVDRTLRMAKENPSWGFGRIEGALANVGYRINDTTVGKSSSRTALSQCRIAAGHDRGVLF